MKIKKHGKSDKKNLKTLVFTCPQCGCVFEASEDEYWEGSNFNSPIGDPNLTWTTTAAYISRHCNCPECHAKCEKTDYNVNYLKVTCSDSSTSNSIKYDTTF